MEQPFADENTIMRLTIFAVVAAALLPAPAAPLLPYIFFSDVESGPNLGGQNNGGAFVNLYGRHFGVNRGDSHITVGGGTVASYPIWSDTHIAFQLGSAAKSGPIVIHTLRGTSNGIPFLIRTGNIYFVSYNGNDSGGGGYSVPWRTLMRARDSIHPGDMVYVMDGVSQTSDDGYGWSAALTLHAESGGTASMPKAMVAYPGATVTIGNVSGPPFGVRSTGPSGHWVIAGMVIRGAVAAVHTDGPSTNWRFVKNDLSCPNNVTGSCFSTSKTSHVRFLGNHVHDVGRPEASAMNHGVYFSTDSNDIEAGWNTIANIRGCRGLQVHSTVIETGTGHNQFNINIHDNVIHDTQCDGIVLATVDPSKGNVKIWNNVIYNAGRGPNNQERTGHWSCILIAGTTNAGPPGGGAVEVYNNTLYNCGSFAQPPYENARSGIANSGKNPNLYIRARNNIVVTQPGVPYLTMWRGEQLCTRFDCAGIVGSTNLFYGNGSAPQYANLKMSLQQNPVFVNPAKHDFHLSRTSPACSGGADAGPDVDIEGVPRDRKTGHGLGAFSCSKP